jgi:hypothetical protein
MDVSFLPAFFEYVSDPSLSTVLHAGIVQSSGLAATAAVPTDRGPRTSAPTAANTAVRLPRRR